MVNKLQQIGLALLLSLSFLVQAQSAIAHQHDLDDWHPVVERCESCCHKAHIDHLDITPTDEFVSSQIVTDFFQSKFAFRDSAFESFTAIRAPPVA
ncbi:hypothetical protein [Paraferrimonas sedimenticola]|uniref:Uncharacterized protein n=1 Tax=Paraferrimonas sedimenticola TaxID=375674 RepID=A0AA37RXY8_9GAMM|nr:hypothetical protein [Paraferrimonas sedimenticola]GLP97275.1 hypothetical protein GCM10007895_25820 [Paraferrimonas sedimenticola]